MIDFKGRYADSNELLSFYFDEKRNKKSRQLSKFLKCSKADVGSAGLLIGAGNAN
jgi:hypothetical protein